MKSKKWCPYWAIGRHLSASFDILVIHGHSSHKLTIIHVIHVIHDHIHVIQVIQGHSCDL
jgi:hypothetical protein